MIKLSIITPTYNSEKFIADCINNVRQLTFPYEHIIIDGGSTDDTISVVESFAMSDNRIIFMKGYPKNIFDKFNSAIKEASGEWIYFLCPDDSILPNSSDKILTMLMESKGYVAYANSKHPHLPEHYNGSFSRLKIMTNNISITSVFYRRSVFGEVGLFNRKYSICADYEMNLRIWLRNLHRTYYPFDIAYYAPGGLSSKNNDIYFHRDYYNIISSNLRGNIFVKSYLYIRLLFKVIKRSFEPDPIMHIKMINNEANKS